MESGDVLMRHGRALAVLWRLAECRVMRKAGHSEATARTHFTTPQITYCPRPVVRLLIIRLGYE